MGRDVRYSCDGDDCNRPVLEATGGTVAGLIVDTKRFDYDGGLSMRRLYFCSSLCAAKHFAKTALPR